MPWHNSTIEGGFLLSFYGSYRFSMGSVGVWFCFVYSSWFPFFLNFIDTLFSPFIGTFGATAWINKMNRSHHQLSLYVKTVYHLEPSWSGLIFQLKQFRRLDHILLFVCLSVDTLKFRCLPKDAVNIFLIVYFSDVIFFPSFCPSSDTYHFVFMNLQDSLAFLLYSSSLKTHRFSLVLIFITYI